ncbi:MAG: hypothetical protein IJ038_05155 [Clostridia bacterium]|nr:hypothetical protein [Clostridia bacterium]
MYRKKITKALCIVFSFIFLMLTLPLSVGAQTTMDASSVLTDLQSMGVDTSLYKKNAEDKNAKVIKFLEYAYDLNGNQSDYGLYLYVYNPTGEQIQNSSFNTVQLSTKSTQGAVYSYGKCRLITVSYSLGEENSYLLYKFKISLPDDFIGSLDDVERYYRIVDLELQYANEANPRMSNISNEYLCSGFQGYHGKDKNSDHSTYYCVSQTLESISIELHPATWKTVSSDKGENYQYEVSSVYFSIPDYYLEKYGNMADENFKGLHSVIGEWYEYKLNGFVTSNANLYDEVYEYELIGYKPTYTESKFSLLHNYVYGYDPTVPFGFYIYDESYEISNSYHYYNRYIGGYQNEKITSLHNAFLYEGGVFEKISTEKLLESIYAPGADNVWHYGYVDDGRTYGHNDYEIMVEDAALNAQIASYASNHNDFVTWLRGKGALNEDKGGYAPIRPIVMITDEYFSDLTTSDAAKAEALFIAEGDYGGLKDFYKASTSDEKTTYLMRFAVTDYYFAEAEVYQSDSGTEKYSGSHYYFEKTIFHNFDVLEFTFRNAEGEYTKVPVSSKPISIVGEITPNENNGASWWDKLGEAKSKWDELASWLKLLIFLAGGSLVLFVVVKVGGKLLSFIIGRSDKRYERKMQKKDLELRRQKEDRYTKKAKESRKKYSPPNADFDSRSGKKKGYMRPNAEIDEFKDK